MVEVQLQLVPSERASVGFLCKFSEVSAYLQSQQRVSRVSSTHLCYANFKKYINQSVTNHNSHMLKYAQARRAYKCVLQDLLEISKFQTARLQIWAQIFFLTNANQTVGGGAHQPRCSSRSAFGPLGIENLPAASCSQRFEKQRRRSQDWSTSDRNGKLGVYLSSYNWTVIWALIKQNPNKVLDVMCFFELSCNCKKLLYLKTFIFCSGVHRIGNRSRNQHNASEKAQYKSWQTQGRKERAARQSGIRILEIHSYSYHQVLYHLYHHEFPLPTLFDYLYIHIYIHRASSFESI